MNGISDFIKQKRQELGITQKELADKAGVGLRFVRECEQGKTTLRMDRVNRLLSMFGHELRPQKIIIVNKTEQ